MLAWESDFLLWLQSIRAPWLDPVMVGITYLGEYGWFWIVSILVFLKIKSTNRTALYALLSVCIAFSICYVMKEAVGRIRPYETIEGLHALVGKQSDYAFPSGHTCVAFAAGWIYYWNFPKKIGVPFLIIAGLIAFSRMYVGVHYPSDVFASFLLATAVAAGVNQMKRKREETAGKS